MQGKKILLVDDEEDIVTLTKHFLETNGYEVAVARNGISALEKAKELPHLILLDVIMPDMDGFKVLQKLRFDPVTAEIPVIMLTCKAETQSLFEAKDLRATDYIVKTSDFEVLLSLVQKYLASDKRRPIRI